MQKNKSRRNIIDDNEWIEVGDLTPAQIKMLEAQGYEVDTTPVKYDDGGYTVKKGDNLSTIAKNNGLTLSELLAMNPNIKDKNLIKVGQRINLPSSYTVKKGDVLSKIAAMSNMTVKDIIKMNPNIQDPNLIRVGDKIQLKRTEVPETKSTVPAKPKKYTGSTTVMLTPEDDSGIIASRIYDYTPQQEQTKEPIVGIYSKEDIYDSYGKRKPNDPITMVPNFGVKIRSNKVYPNRPGTVTHVVEMPNGTWAVLVDAGNGEVDVYNGVDKPTIKKGSSVSSKTFIGNATYDSQYDETGFEYQTYKLNNKLVNTPYKNPFVYDVVDPTKTMKMYGGNVDKYPDGGETLYGGNLLPEVVVTPEYKSGSLGSYRNPTKDSRLENALEYIPIIGQLLNVNDAMDSFEHGSFSDKLFGALSISPTPKEITKAGVLYDDTAELLSKLTRRADVIEMLERNKFLKKYYLDLATEKGTDTKVYEKAKKLYDAAMNNSYGKELKGSAKRMVKTIAELLESSNDAAAAFRLRAKAESDKYPGGGKVNEDEYLNNEEIKYLETLAPYSNILPPIFITPNNAYSVPSGKNKSRKDYFDAANEIMNSLHALTSNTSQAKIRLNYPYISTLTKEERKLFNDQSPIGRQIRLKAKTGSGITVKDAEFLADNFVGLGALNNADQIGATGQAALVEGVEALRGNEYSFKNALPHFGMKSTQRTPDEAWIANAPLLQNMPNIKWMLGALANFVIDPFNLFPIMGAKKTVLKATANKADDVSGVTKFLSDLEIYSKRPSTIETGSVRATPSSHAPVTTYEQNLNDLLFMKEYTNRHGYDFPTTPLEDMAKHSDYVDNLAREIADRNNTLVRGVEPDLQALRAFVDSDADYKKLIDHMKSKGVDLNDPNSIAEYMITHTPILQTRGGRNPAYYDLNKNTNASSLFTSNKHDVSIGYAARGLTKKGRVGVIKLPTEKFTPGTSREQYITNSARFRKLTPENKKALIREWSNKIINEDGVGLEHYNLSSDLDFNDDLTDAIKTALYDYKQILNKINSRVNLVDDFTAEDIIDEINKLPLSSKHREEVADHVVNRTKFFYDLSKKEYPLLEKYRDLTFELDSMLEKAGAYVRANGNIPEAIGNGTGELRLINGTAPSKSLQSVFNNYIGKIKPIYKQMNDLDTMKFKQWAKDDDMEEKLQQYMSVHLRTTSNPKQVGDVMGQAEYVIHGSPGKKVAELKGIFDPTDPKSVDALKKIGLSTATTLPLGVWSVLQHLQTENKQYGLDTKSN